MTFVFDRLKILICVFFLPSFAFGATTSSKVEAHVQETKLQSFKKVLSYDEVSRLSKEKRITYVQGVRSLLSDIENRTPGQKRSGRSPANETTAAVAGLPYQAGTKIRCGGAGYTVLKVFGADQDTRTNNYVCVTNQYEQKKIIDVYSKGCPAGTRQVSSDGPRCERTETVMAAQKKPCALGMVPIKQDAEGSYLCATPNSFARLPLGAKHNLRASTYMPFVSRPSLLAKVLGPGHKAYFQSTGPSLESIIAQERARDRKTEASQKPWGPWESPIEHCPSLGPNNEYIDKAPPEYAMSVRARCAAFAQGKPLPPLVKQQLKKNRPVVVASRPSLKTARVRAQAPVPSTRIQLTPSGEADWETASGETPAEAPPAEAPQAEASEASSPELRTCEPKAEVTCDADAIEDARRRYVSDSNPDCIYAGSVVGYEGGVKRSFKCEPPRSFCFGSSSCRSDSGEAMTPAFSCGTKGVLCNPLLFGVQSDGKTPFCVDRAANATLSCEARSSEDPDAVQILDSEHSGVREAWDNFANRLNQLCEGNATAKTLHCEECQVIRERLFKLNAAARNVETCGAALKFEELNRSPKTSAPSKKKPAPSSGAGSAS